MQEWIYFAIGWRRVYDTPYRRDGKTLCTCRQTVIAEGATFTGTTPAVIRLLFPGQRLLTSPTLRGAYSPSDHRMQLPTQRNLPHRRGVSCFQPAHLHNRFNWIHFDVPAILGLTSPSHELVEMNISINIDDKHVIQLNCHYRKSIIFLFYIGMMHTSWA